MEVKKELDVNSILNGSFENTYTVGKSHIGNQLTKYIDITGRGFKPSEQLMSTILAPLEFPCSRNISVDCTHVELRTEYLVQCTNFIYAIIDDPYILGKIACASILSNLYASGVIHCDGILLTIGISTKMPKEERSSVILAITNGFRDCAIECATKVKSGRCIYNPWIMVGGTATSASAKADCIMSYKARAGDVLVLTKPLGTQIAININSWLNKPEFWNVAKNVITKEDAKYAFDIALASMSRPNYIAAQCMTKYDIHGVTHVGGNGLLGHAKILLKNMEKNMSFVIYNLPIIDKIAAVSKAFDKMFHFMEGFCPETSGGLLICMSREHAQSYLEDLRSTGNQGWIIGTIEKDDTKTIQLIPDPYIIHVNLNSLHGIGV